MAFDRRAVLGKSKAELVMSRVGQVMAVLYLLLLLPVLPILAVYFGLHKLASLLTGGQAGGHGYEPDLG